MKNLPQQVQQINPEHLIDLHNYYFGEPEEEGFAPPEDVINNLVFWANEAGASEDTIQDALRLAGFIKDLFSPVRTYGLRVPENTTSTK